MEVMCIATYFYNFCLYCALSCNTVQISPFLLYTTFHIFTLYPRNTTFLRYWYVFNTVICNKIEYAFVLCYYIVIILETVPYFFPFPFQNCSEIFFFIFVFFYLPSLLCYLFFFQFFQCISLVVVHYKIPLILSISLFRIFLNILKLYCTPVAKFEFFQ